MGVLGLYLKKNLNLGQNRPAGGGGGGGEAPPVLSYIKIRPECRSTGYIDYRISIL